MDQLETVSEPRSVDVQVLYQPQPIIHCTMTFIVCNSNYALYDHS